VRWVERLSLLSGPLPILLALGAIAAFAVAAIGGGRRWYRDLVLLTLGSLAAVVAVGTALGIEHKVGSSFPRSFFVWAALPVVAAAVAAIRWRSSAWNRRLVSLLAVALLLGFGADNVNAHYAYLPTVGDLIGRPLADQVPVAAIAHGRPHRGRQPQERASGVVVAVDIPGVASGFHGRTALVWLPPAYFSLARPTLPAVMMLGGVPGDPSNMIRAAHAEVVADAYAAAHHGRAPIVVFPDHNGGFLNDTECVDGPRGNAETYLMVDVPRFVEARFGASDRGSAWGIVGYSEGGTCAVTLALRHPDRFGAFVDIGGDLRPSAASGRLAQRSTIRRLYGGDVRQWARHDPLTLLRHRWPAGPRAVFVAGTEDASGRADGQVLAQAACRAGLVASLVVVPGGHSFATVHRALVEVVPGVFDQLVGPAPPMPGCGPRHVPPRSASTGWRLAARFEG
jgi:S-formylglutathione hydrolase FrmB